MNEYVITPQSKDASMEVREAVEHCARHHIPRLVLTKGEYHFYTTTAAEDTNSCVSNHGHNGYRRVAFLVKDRQDFEIDCSGSLLVFHGAMNAFIFRRCRNVTVRGANILTEKTLHGQFEITAVGADYVDLTTCTPQGFVYDEGLLYLENEQSYRNLVYTAEEIERNSGEYATGEQCFGMNFLHLQNADMGNGTVRIYNPPRKPKLGNYVVLLAAERYNNAILFLESENVKAEDCCIHSCYGIGYHAQLCRNVEISHCRTAVYGNRCFSANADATHFVGCSGLVHIHDCCFERQLDDAINIHGVYTRIVDKDEESIYVTYVHFQCRGIGLFRDGCRVGILEDKNLIPYHETRVTRAVELNTECTRLFLEGGTEHIRMGDIADSLDCYPETIIEDNRFVNNRARGILIGTREKAVIRNNYFHTTGTAIKLECDCVYWYESGSVQSLVIENNTFDNCQYIDSGSWGRDILYVTPREENIEGAYYHGHITVRGNDFSTCRGRVAKLENIRELTFTDNILNDYPDTVAYSHCGTVTVQ